MAKDKSLKNLYKDMLYSVDMTQEQLNFLLENYLDEDTIIGIHNTSFDYNSFFRDGLYNQTSMGGNSVELANTIMYTDLLCGLAVYPNGDGNKRGNSAIILKIPKKVFTKEQGIFETLPNKRYGIPSQFIVGAFQGGKVFTNEKYDKEYKNEEAIKCIDEVIMQDKKMNVKIFHQVYTPKIKRIKQNILNFFKNLKRKDKKLLLGNGENDQTCKRTQFHSNLSSNSPTLEEQRDTASNYINTLNKEDLKSFENNPNEEIR